MLRQVLMSNRSHDNTLIYNLDISSWNSLFVGSNAVADQMAKKYDLNKAELLKRDDVAVQLALGESQIVNDIKDYLVNHGIGFIFSRSRTERV